MGKVHGVRSREDELGAGAEESHRQDGRGPVFCSEPQVYSTEVEKDIGVGL